GLFGRGTDFAEERDRRVARSTECGGGGVEEFAVSPSSPVGLRRAPRFFLRALRGCATRSPKGEAWWSQAGSNRRPLACHASALPAELWPLDTFAHDLADHAASAPWATHRKPFTTDRR